MRKELSNMGGVFVKSPSTPEQRLAHARKQLWKATSPSGGNAAALEKIVAASREDDGVDVEIKT